MVERSDCRSELSTRSITDPPRPSANPPPPVTLMRRKVQDIAALNAKISSWRERQKVPHPAIILRRLRSGAQRDAQCEQDRAGKAACGLCRRHGRQKPDHPCERVSRRLDYTQIAPVAVKASNEEKRRATKVIVTCAGPRLNPPCGNRRGSQFKSRPQHLAASEMYSLANQPGLTRSGPPRLPGTGTGYISLLPPSSLLGGPDPAVANQVTH
jgi:hypothetical protein